MAAKSKKGASPGELLVCSNPNATKRYVIEERLECGMELTGSEVKSMRGKHADLEGAYAAVSNGQLFLHNMYVGPYAQAGAFGHELKRVRRLLAKKHEIERLQGKVAIRGYTLVPIRAYFKNGWAKVELGLAKSKDVGDRRHDLRKKADMREARAAVQRGRGK